MLNLLKKLSSKNITELESYHITSRLVIDAFNLICIKKHKTQFNLSISYSNTQKLTFRIFFFSVQVVVQINFKKGIFAYETFI